MDTNVQALLAVQEWHDIHVYEYMLDLTHCSSNSLLSAGGVACFHRIVYGSRLKGPIHAWVWLASPTRLGFQLAKLVRVWVAKLGVSSCVCDEINPSPAPESISPSRTRTCMGPLSSMRCRMRRHIHTFEQQGRRQFSACMWFCGLATLSHSWPHRNLLSVRIH
jgi:hypothetical protein